MLISKLKALTRLILETDTGVLYQLTVTEPEHNVGLLTCHEPSCRIREPVACKVLGAEVGHKIEPSIQQNRRLVIRAGDTDYIFGPIVSVLVEGADWHYDLWGQP